MFRDGITVLAAAVGALCLVVLAGCSSVNNGLISATRTLAELNRPVLSLNDNSNAGWIKDARGVASLRTPRFFAQSRVSQALIEACRQGKWAEVIVSVEGAREIGALKGTCVNVYVSDHPAISRGFDVLLLDSDTVVSEGRLLAVNNRDSRQEYSYRQLVKQMARQMN